MLHFIARGVKKVAGKKGRDKVAGKKMAGKKGREKVAGKKMAGKKGREKVAVAILAGQSGDSNFSGTKWRQKVAILDDQMMPIK